MSPDELKHYRKHELGLSQAQLARRLGIHALTVSFWERGTQRPAPYLHLALLAIKEDLETERAA